ncbi:ABC transporter permease subunit [Phyllobacterium sp. LjRoot231]|uniref:ABC transporter permease subunit n=1 Tax=Phyllobacterium sp. LjRoot231 TaxID=3342289 RepID=UPI003ED070EF
MIERTPILNVVTYFIMILGLLLILGPFWMIFTASTQSLSQVNTVPFNFAPGADFLQNIQSAWHRANLGPAMFNSLIMALLVMIGKIVLASLSAFAIVYFRSPLRHVFFWMVFMTLMLPLEVRVVPTYNIASDVFQPVRWLIQIFTGIELSLQWNLLNSYSGLVLPVIATATGTFLYRQFYMTLPDELTEAAKMDGARPLRFFIDILLPLSRTNMLALATIMFVYAWNQYLWPKLMTTEADYQTAMVAMTTLVPNVNSLPEWNVSMAGALIIMLPPLVVVAVLQRWFVRGLVSTEK